MQPSAKSNRLASRLDKRTGPVGHLHCATASLRLIPPFAPNNSTASRLFVVAASFFSRVDSLSSYLASPSSLPLLSLDDYAEPLLKLRLYNLELPIPTQIPPPPTYTGTLHRGDVCWVIRFSHCTRISWTVQPSSISGLVDISTH